MTQDKGILIKNIYYMLSYAFQVLKQDAYENIATEDFEHIHDLFAAIIANGVAQQLKRGLYREYLVERDDLSTLRGKMDFQGSLKNKLQRRQVLTCEYDELSENNMYNRVLKTTMLILLRQEAVSTKHKCLIKKNLLMFDRIDELEPRLIQWSKIRYQKNNQSYRMLMNLCRLVIEGMLLTTEAGSYKMASYIDEQSMSRLYEKFILEYYRYHHPELKANSEHIKWKLDDDNDMWLPSMITDITLKKDEKVLIIDAKYYEEQMQNNYGTMTFKNANLYQIFTYVKNYDINHTGNVSGMLLYAKTGESIQPENSFMMDGNKISVCNLNLNLPFMLLAEQLERIAESL